MILDCHLHTWPYSQCSSIEPEYLCALAIERGLNGIVITEHHRWWPKEEIERLRSDFPELAIYNGVEVTLAEGYDVVLIGPELHQTPNPFISLESFLDLLAGARRDSFLFVAHAFRYPWSNPANLIKILAHMDGLEMNSGNILRGKAVCRDSRYYPSNFSQYAQTLENYNLIPLYNSDAHSPDAVGAIANQLDLTHLPEDEKKLASALKTQMPRQMQRPDMLEKILNP